MQQLQIEVRPSDYVPYSYSPYCLYAFAQQLFLHLCGETLHRGIQITSG